MKNRTISILLGLLAFVTGGCEDMLDRFPKDKLTPKIIFIPKKNAGFIRMISIRCFRMVQRYMVRQPM